MENAEETKQRHIDKLGPELGDVYNKLFEEWARGNVKLNEIRLLYGNLENVNYVNTFGGHFFGHIQDILLDDMLLNVTRLTDPVQSGRGKKNLTILLLPTLLENEAFRKEVNDGIEIAVVSSGFARDWRNRRIAHRDYNLEFNKNAEPLETANLQKIDHALTDVHTVLNLINERLLDGPMANLVWYLPKIEGMISNLKRRGV